MNDKEYSEIELNSLDISLIHSSLEVVIEALENEDEEENKMEKIFLKEMYKGVFAKVCKMQEEIENNKN